VFLYPYELSSLALGISILIPLPIKSLLFNSKALAIDDSSENLTNPLPLDLPSSFLKSLTNATLPHPLKKFLRSYSVASKLSYPTNISNNSPFLY
jgi:hypothetical protein